MVHEDQSATEPTSQPQLHELVATVCAPALCLSATDGQIRHDGAQGLYIDDVRVLSALEVSIDGVAPTPLGHDLVGGNQGRFRAAAFNVGREGADPRVFVDRDRLLHGRGMTESIIVRSYAAVPLHLRVEVRASCDLAGMVDVKSGRFPPSVCASQMGGRLLWGFGDETRVVLATSPTPTRIVASTATLSWDVEIAARGAMTFEMAIALEGRDRHVSVVVPARMARLERPCVEAEDERIERFVQRSVADLDALRLSLADCPNDVFLAAGVPWFLTLFGRDSIWAARMLLPLGTELAAGTLRTLTARQGKVRDTRTGEQPGKILHEVRRERTDHRLWRGEHGEPLSLPPVYYGTVDATPLWISLLHDAWRWGMPEAEVAGLLEPMLGCLRWIAQYGCVQDGFVSYVDESGSGLTNQGWKDSHDAIQFRDGRLARAPLALCEVQGYAYEAMAAGAALLDAFDRPGAEEWRELAGALAQGFRKSFWVHDAGGPYPAVALDRDGAAVDSLTSNIAHLLGTGILDDAEEELVASRLASPVLDCGYGLRTLAADSAGFNPLSYHCGSVWGHDTAIAILGLARSGGSTARRAAVSLIDGLLAAAEAFEYRMPELYGGHGRAYGGDPLPYPASCRPQAWSAAASIAVLSALTGIRPDVPNGMVHVSPLSSRLSRVGGLRLGGRSVALEFDGGTPALLGADEELHVVP